MALVAENILSDAIERSVRTVQLKAVNESWPSVSKPKQGGSERAYVRDLLPVKYQQAITARESMVPGGVKTPLQDIHIPQDIKKVGLAKFQLIMAYRLHKESAPWGETGKAANDFVLAYNAGVHLPQLLAVVGQMSKRTLDALDKKLKNANDNYLVVCDGRGGWKKYRTTKWRGRKLSEHAKVVFLKCYLNPARPSVIMAIRATRITLEKYGHIESAEDTTYRRWLRDFEKTNAHVICMAREGVKAYTDKYGPYGTRDASLLKVGQCLVADGKTLNFFVLHPQTGRACRMKLIVFLDWKSRYPCGWQIMPNEDTIAIMAAFRNAVESLGDYPQSVYLDNGKAFKSKLFTDTDPDFEELTGLYARVGTAVTFAKPYNGRAKVVERFFKTVQDQLEFMMPSYCGDSIQTKPAWMSRNETFHKAWHEARSKNWIPTIREAAVIIDAYFKWYARQPHEDLPDTPERLFLEGRGPGVDPVQLNHDFLWRKTVVPHHCRVTLWGIDYESDGLHGLSRQHKIMAMYDTADMSRIWCYTADGDYLCQAEPVQALHPLANLFGSQVSMDQVKQHNKRLGALKKQTREKLIDLGVSREAQDALNILPFAGKVPILQTPELTNSTRKAVKALPEKKISDKEVKRLEHLAEKTEQEASTQPAIPRPKYWSSDLEHYEWVFRLQYQHRQTPAEADQQFMTMFELLPSFDNYRQRFEDLKLLFD